MNRKTASTKTAISGVILQLISIFLGFVNQRVFIAHLGVEYSGIISIFGNILSILTMSDLGVSSAIIFHLYKSLAKGDHKQTSALLDFYHKACKIIATFVFLGGAIMMFFMPSIVGQTTVQSNLYVLFFLYIIIASLQYAFNYRRVLLSADQRGYIINSVLCVTDTLLYIAKIFIIVFTKNIYFYATAIIIKRLIENFVIGVIVKKRYSGLLRNQKINNDTRIDIKKKMYASVFHNSAAYIVNFTDNIIISKVFSIAIVGFYNNYNMIISAINTLLDKMLNGVTASLGNLFATSGSEKTYKISKNLLFLNFWVYSVFCICTFCCLPSFISFWIGPEYIMDNIVAITLIVNLFVRGMRAIPKSLLSAAGIFYENRHIPIIEALINLSTSIILAHLIGLPGVFVGTILSNLFLHFYSYPKYVYNKVLNRDRREYIFIFSKYFIIFIITWFGVSLIMPLINFNNYALDFIAKGLVAFILPCIFYQIIFFKTPEFKYFYELVQKIPERISKKLKALK